EILRSVRYPTGGKVAFEYQPNTYSQRLNSDFTYSGVSNTEGGGVRIYKITYYANDNEVSFEKTYEYTIPGTTTSSGFLSTTPQQYLLSLNPPTNTNFVFRSSGYNPVYYSGSPVT